jgi:hypothetical protein
MRLTRLLVATLLVVLAGRIALGQDFALRSGSKSHSARSSSAATPTAVPYFPRTEVNRSGESAGDDSAESNVCLALRTMVVARDDNRSDSTHLVSQRTCTPSRQFQMKSAVVNLNAK